MPVAWWQVAPTFWTLHRGGFRLDGRSTCSESRILSLPALVFRLQPASLCYRWISRRLFAVGRHSTQRYRAMTCVELLLSSAFAVRRQPPPAVFWKTSSNHRRAPTGQMPRRCARTDCLAHRRTPSTDFWSSGARLDPFLHAPGAERTTARASGGPPTGTRHVTRPGVAVSDVPLSDLRRHCTVYIAFLDP